MRNFNEEIDRISKKYRYSQELTDVLKRVIPVKAEGKTEEQIDMLLDALSETKIFVLPDDAKVEDLERCKNEIFPEQGITFKEAKESEYNNVELAAGAYISEPVFDENMNITGRNRMLYIKELYKTSRLREVYGTGIDLDHLVHELDHMAVAQKDEYIQNSDGSFVQNVGAGRIIHSVDRENRIVTAEKTKGLYIEESLTTINQEREILKLTGARNISELKSKGYVPSSYQGFQTDIMKAYVEKFGVEEFEKQRYSKDRSVLNDIEAALRETEAWETLGTEKYVAAKKERITECVDSLEVNDEAKNMIKSMFEKYDDVFFSTANGMTPMGKLDNVLEQTYNFNTVKYNFGILDNDKNMELYKKVVTSIIAEGYALKNEARDIERPVAETNSMENMLASQVCSEKEVIKNYTNEHSRDEKSVSVSGRDEP